MTVRRASVADAKRISEIAEPFHMGPEEEFAEAISREDAIWVIDEEEGGCCQVERRSRFQAISVGPLLPLDMGDDKAMTLLQDCIARAYRTFVSERGWKIHTYIPAENRHAADSFQAWFQADRRDLPAGDVILSLPTLELAYRRSQQWQVR